MNAAIVLCLFGTLASSIGTYLISLKYILLGNLLVLVVGEVFGALALRFSPVSVVAPMSSFTITWSVLLAPVFTDKKLTFKNVALAFLCMFGCALVVANSVHTSEKIFHQFITSIFIINGLGFIFLYFLFFRLWMFPTEYLIRDAIFTGIVGGFSNTAGKTIFLALEQDDRYLSLCIVSTVIFLVAQSLLINRNIALYTNDTETVNTIYIISLIVSIFIIGGTTFDEFKELKFDQCAYIMLGLAISILSILFMKYNSVAPI